MQDFVRFVGTNYAVEIFGINLMGVNSENGKKFLFSLAFVVVALLPGRVFHLLASLMFRSSRNERIKFWVPRRSGIGIASDTLEIVGLPSLQIRDRIQGG